MVGEKMKDTDKVYNVKVIPDIEDNILLRVPKGVEINEEILRKDCHFEDYWSEDPIINPRCRLEISEVKDKELWNDYDHPSLHKNGFTHYEGCELDDVENP